MAYFQNELSLSDMVNHIYNGVDGIVRADRPNMFINELKMYLNYFSEKIEQHKNNWGRKSEKQLNNFADNMSNGIAYYQKMFDSIGENFSNARESVTNALDEAVESMRKMRFDISVIITSAEILLMFVGF